MPSSKLDAPVKLVGPVMTESPVWAVALVPITRSAVKARKVNAVRMVLGLNETFRPNPLRE